MKSSLSITPTLLTFQNETIDNSKRIADIKTNTLVLSAKYFSIIGNQAKMKYSPKNYTDYITNENSNSFFSSPTEKEEIKVILLSLDITEAAAPYSSATNVLKLLKNDIPDQLANLFNLSFTTGSFLNSFKIRLH